MNTVRVRADFDEIARLADSGASGTDRYDRFLLSVVPANAMDVLDVGCGLGRLTSALATRNRDVLGVDLSPAMIERARLTVGRPGVSFLCGDFLQLDFGAQRFDCVVSGAALHHMSQDAGVVRMAGLLRPGGRLIIHDLRRDSGVAEVVRSHVALAQVALGRFVRSGQVRSPRAIREAWERHGATETYLSRPEAKALAKRLLPGAHVYTHWLWRYTIVWDKGQAA